MLRAVLLFLILYTPIGYAYDLSVSKTGVIENLPICLVEGGVKVAYIPSRELVWRNGSIVALAGRTPTGMPAIIYDPIAFADAPPEFQLWVLNHECHHHQGKHFGAALSHPSYTTAIENSADKWATLKLFRQGLTPLQIETVHATISDDAYHDKHTPMISKRMRASRGISTKLEYTDRAARFKRYAKESLKLLQGG